MQSNPEHEEVGGSDQYLISRENLAQVVQANCTDAIITHCGGIENIVSALRTNLDEGIKGDETDLRRRREAFGRNFVSNGRPLRTTTTIKRIKNLLSEASSNTTILLLLCCALLSLAIGIKTDGAAEALVDGAIFLLAVSSIVSFGTLIRFLKARLGIRRSSKKKKKQNDDVWVVRDGMTYPVLESELVVGDIVFLQTGDLVPADGIFINGDDSFHPCLFRGEKVVVGHCRMLVTSVGDDTERSRLIKSTENGEDHDRLQLLDAIERTSSKLDKIWLSLSLLLLLLQFVRCFVSKKVEGDKDRSSDPKGVKNRMEDLMKESMKMMKKKEKLRSHSLITMLCVLLFASREGLPLAVFVSLLYASNRMKSLDGAIVRQLEASSTVGLTTTVCTCKTADLALQHLKMADLWIGFDLVVLHDQIMQEKVDGKVLDALRRGIAVHGLPRGSVEEISLLNWARAVLGLDSSSSTSSSSMVRHEIDTNLCCSTEKGESMEGDEVVHVHWGGAPELIWSMCSHYYTVDGEIETLDATKTAAFVENLGQCCFAFAYKREINVEEEEEEDTIKTLETLKSNLTLLGFVCLKNPYSPHLIKAVEDCRRSGVGVRLVVDDDVNTARIMAVNSGILMPEHDGGAVVDATDFRSRSDDERMIMADKMIVMANATPSDKMLMMQCLRQNRHVVAAAAAAVRDSPLLKQADVGIFMGDRWTEVSKDDGDIVVPTSNFSEIPQIVNLGRRVCSSLEKFLQLQLTMEISAFAINIISVAATSEEALAPFQVLWINLTMEILGAAAVAVTTVQTPPSGTTEENPVYGRSGRIVTRSMCGVIAIQSFFQVGVILVMAMKGKTVFQVNEYVLRAMIFNCYAFCQVFLLISIKRNDAVASASWLFVGIVAMIEILQVAAVEIVGAVAQRPRLEVTEWCVCVGIASLSLPLSWISICD